jgi:hypothetical protein
MRKGPRVEALHQHPYPVKGGPNRCPGCSDGSDRTRSSTSHFLTYLPRIPAAKSLSREHQLGLGDPGYQTFLVVVDVVLYNDERAADMHRLGGGLGIACPHGAQEAGLGLDGGGARLAIGEVQLVSPWFPPLGFEAATSIDPADRTVDYLRGHARRGHEQLCPLWNAELNATHRDGPGQHGAVYRYAVELRGRSPATVDTHLLSQVAASTEGTHDRACFA